MLFLLIFTSMINIVFPQLYENMLEAEITQSTISTVKPCLVENTEHFVRKSETLIPGKIILNSSRMVETVVSHYLFLLDIDRDIIWHKTTQKWYIKLSFQDVHKYMQLAFDDLSLARDACHPFLIIRKNASIFYSVYQG